VEQQGMDDRLFEQTLNELKENKNEGATNHHVK
jgi:hypothetical protein